MSTTVTYTATLPSTHTHTRQRTRTSSIFSASSGTSLASIFEISKSSSTSGVSQRPDKHQAYGSFVPVRSATPTLQEFVLYSVRTPRRRKVTFDDRVSFSHDVDDSDEYYSSDIPSITRTFPSLSYDCPPSPTSSSSSTSIHTPEPRDASELHPILAKLERKSKFCGNVAQCSTCRKKGADFPRCAKCGDMWCSRACRLVDGKRHVCTKVQ
ncbi:hypothetical protein CPC08DRAFT_354872 [Agrocybe pediades]|nr:hypothetical protein CPC08DRAFT_354872 [Agrocybe pediades]